MLAEQQHLLPLAEEGFDLASLHFAPQGADQLLLGAAAGGRGAFRKRVFPRSRHWRTLILKTRHIFRQRW
jgi:hypothetical protein